MSGSELAAVVVAVASVAGVALFGVALVALVRTLRAVRVTVELFHEEAIGVLGELTRTVAAANGELDRLDGVLDRAESISGTVDVGSRLAYRALSTPVIKAMAAASGTGEAARGFRRRRADGRPRR